MQRKVFLGIGPQKYQKKAGRKSTRYISTLRRENLSLTGCSSAEPVSVSVQPCKSHLILLYLQLVKKDSHLPTLKNQKKIFMNYLIILRSVKTVILKKHICILLLKQKMENVLLCLDINQRK